MEFGLSKEQLLLQDSVARYLDRDAPLARVQRFVNAQETRAGDVWAGLCELGIPAMLVGQEHGGIGLSLLDAALVAEILGSRVAPVPFVATVALVPLAIAAAGSKSQQSQWLPALAQGSVVAGAALSEAVSSREGAAVDCHGLSSPLAPRAEGGARSLPPLAPRGRGVGGEGAATTLSGRALFVLDFAADVYLVADRNRALYLVDAGAAGLERRALATIDKTRAVGELVLDDVPAELLPGSADPALCARIIDAGRILLAADTLGAAQTMLTRAVEYSKQRVQFDRVVGSFQAVKHMCAEMAAQLEPCRAMMWYAAYAFDAIGDEAPLTACHTKAHVSEVGTFVARTATEVHGGIGFTDELGLHLWFKRIGANRQLLGGPDRLREEAARLQQLV